MTAAMLTPAGLECLRARAGLADAIVVAARQQPDAAGARPRTEWNRSLYEGCCVALTMRETATAKLRAELIAAERVA